MSVELLAGALNAAHLGSSIDIPDRDYGLEGFVLMRISHEKRFRTGTFLGFTTAEEYSYPAANSFTPQQRTGVFLPVGTQVILKGASGTVYACGTAGATDSRGTGLEAHLPGGTPKHGTGAEIVEHEIGRGTSFTYPGRGSKNSETFPFDQLVALLRTDRLTEDHTL